MKSKQRITAVEQHPLAGSSFISLMKLFLWNGGVDREYLPQALSAATASFLTIPLKIFENVKFSQKIAELEIELPPIFILGHPRSGTTYFQYLMSRDPNLGYLENWQAMRGSEIFLSSPELAKRWADSNYPRKRISDEVMMYANSPAEEEFPLANACPYSFYTWFYFPNNMRKIFQKFVLFEGVDDRIKTEWKRAYIKNLKRITLAVNGKRLILKNPINTARIKILLEMFPDAKFIHLYRNPYSIYASTNTLYKKLVRVLGFQTINEAELEENIIFIYKQMMQKFLVDKNSLPPENLIEIKYEDFIGNEIEYLKQVYAQFNLPSFEQAEAEFKKYIQSQANYETNKYTLDEETIKKITEQWRFTIEKWQYDVPDELTVKAAP
ncbi:sulfotransferase [Hassallia byssoidea VB512170]|uniref:Sulfotransferase n=1 Tax=Hassallia byssoidea VB512170 TaxID=1304833 RepID=A0A846HCM2_9CYAN|nr:sulfotransferase [Hassalia byssoidea]NEU74340.1 sulfotransferase [Hassalia byssoidea VB512170]